MNLKTFRAPSMATALEQVKKQFGRDAVILSTRTATDGGILGIGGRSYVEITAAPHPAEPNTKFHQSQPKNRFQKHGTALGSSRRIPPTQRTENTLNPRVLESELGELKTLVHQLVTESRHERLQAPSHATSEFYRALVANDVAEEIAQQLVEQVCQELPPDKLNDTTAVRARLATAVQAMLPTGGAIRLDSGTKPKIVSLIGPTGVGKTTTIAKLAAQFCLREHKKVGLITIDTYRIAAVEQLRTYAEIIDLPLEVVMTPKEYRDAVERLGGCDIILVDTAGRSQRDTTKHSELMAFFQEVAPEEIHLVLSSTCSEAVLLETVHRFSVFGIDRIIFTKLDEAIGFGVILACLQKAKAKLSYITTGQNVPEDIRVGEGKVLSKLILAKVGRSEASCLALPTTR